MDPRLPRLPLPDIWAEPPDWTLPWPKRLPPVKRPPIIAPERISPPTPNVGIPPNRIAVPREVEIPAPPVELPTEPLPQRTPPNPVLAPPRVSTGGRQRQGAHVRTTFPTEILQGISPVYRQRRQTGSPFQRVARRELLRREQTARDRYGDPVGVDRFGDPILGGDPLGLTNPNALALGSAQRQRREECCKCEDEEEEKKMPRPSSVVAKVKAFARRMSQNSLDNLR
jgi:hypothetical protein